MAHHSVTLLLLSANRSSIDEPSVLQPYHIADLLVLMQTTHPAVFTRLFAISRVFGHQHRPSLHPCSSVPAGVFAYTFPFTLHPR